MKKPLKQQLDWTNILFLTLTPLFAVILSIIYFKTSPFSYKQILLFIFFYFASGIAITAGYHRLIAHRAYKTNAFVKFLYLFFGAGAFENSALKWAHDHRIHHHHVDDELDPYNINRGFFYAHIGWIFFKEPPLDMNAVAEDLKKDKLVLWQHRHYLVLAVISGLLLPALAGHLLGSALGGLALSGFLRIVFVHHCTFFINSLCHIVGKKTYTDKFSARDSFLMAFFSYGEGYHNYHHYFPTDYRNGVRWYQYDPTKWLIATLSLMGLAHDLKKVPMKQILKAKKAMLLKERPALL